MGNPIRSIRPRPRTRITRVAPNDPESRLTKYDSFFRKRVSAEALAIPGYQELSSCFQSRVTTLLPRETLEWRSSQMRRLSLLTALAGLALSAAAIAQSPLLLKDINTKPKANPPSNPTGYTHNYSTPWDNYKFAKIGPFVIFQANDGVHGNELFKSLPAPNTATLIKDIRPGSSSSSPSYFTNFGSKVIFAASDGTHGTEPWVTDGTAAGTFMLKDCYAGNLSGGCYYPVVMGGKVYWTSYNGTNYSIWVSDGTTAGTSMVYSGLRYTWYYPVAFGNKILFRGNTSANGFEPWVTDGTAAGTKMLLDVQAGTASGYIYYPVAMGNKCYFFSHPSSGYTLYVTDGTPTGTSVVKGGFGFYWYNPIPLGTKIVFRGRMSASGYEPWITDGTAAGTVLLKDIKPGTGSGHFYSPVVFNNKVYFAAFTATASTYSIWETDGTSAGTKVVSSKSRFFYYPTVAGGYIFFRGYHATGTRHDYELWKTNGTDAGTMEVKDIRPGPSSSYPYFITPVIGSKVVFQANDGVHGTELWISDGTATGTTLLDDIVGPGANTRASYPSDILGVSGITYFTANDGVHGTELWKTDGTAAGTALVKDINTGTGSGAYLYQSKMYYWRSDGSLKPAALGKTLFFQGHTSTAGGEIWKTDGTAAGTVMVKDIRPGSISGNFYYGCVMGNHVYFFANDGSGYALWKTDGTTAGTVKVKGGFSFYWHYPFPYNGKIYFSGQTSSNGREPWVTDGTAAGTVMLKDIRSGSGSAYFFDPTVMGGKVYFRAYKAAGGGFAIYVTDGTPAGTKLAFTINGYNGYYLTAMGNKLFFRGYDSTHGGEPWVSDGTQAGTKLLKDIRPGKGSGYFYYPCVVGNTLFFRSNDGTKGYELWKTDGTAAGTVMVKDIHPGAGSSYASQITAIGSRHAVFAATDGIHGTELWKSDGTAAGTMMLKDIYPGTRSSSPNYMTLSGGQVLFKADDGIHGYEPWVWFPGATAKAFGFGTNDLLPLTATDPALGTTMKMTLSGMGTSQAGLLILAAPTTNPTAISPGWIYFDISTLYMGIVVTPAGGGATTLPVPNDPALVGAQIASQGFVYPASTPPIGVDFTNGVLLTFGN